MSKPKVYIDGKDGTTGLQIYGRLAAREDIDLLLIDEKKRKDLWERKRLMDGSDVVFLCLPDEAARQIVELAEKPTVRVIDCSTAHRTAPGWVYGFAELLPGQRKKIASSKRVANPGCHATGFLTGVAPLVELGALPRDYPLTCFSLTGYSGGGKGMIAEYEAPDRGGPLSSPAPYALGLTHKHLPEMQKVAGLDYPPAFLPVVDDFYKGMTTCVLLQNRLLKGAPDARSIHELLSAYYQGQRLIRVAPFGGESPRLYANAMAGTDALLLTVSGHEEQTLIAAQFDNLGKGASGAAVQNMNLMLGLDETAGLALEPNE